MTIADIANQHELPVDLKLHSEPDSVPENTVPEKQDGDEDKAKMEESLNAKHQVKDDSRTEVGQSTEDKDMKEMVVALKQATMICEYTHLYLVTCAITHRKYCQRCTYTLGLITAIIPENKVVL